MNLLDFYAKEARKHGMTYGRYEQAIHNGEIPVPKLPKCMRVLKKPAVPPIRTVEDVKTYRKCRRCEKMFEIPTPESQKKYCPGCIPAVLREAGAKRRTVPDYYSCELCGTEFFRGRYPGRRQARQGKMCSTCYDKWLHMNTTQKKAFKNGERTLERLEEIRSGYKKDC